MEIFRFVFANYIFPCRQLPACKVGSVVVKAVVKRDVENAGLCLTQFITSQGQPPQFNVIPHRRFNQARKQPLVVEYRQRSYFRQVFNLNVFAYALFDVVYSFLYSFPCVQNATSFVVEFCLCRILYQK